MTGTSENLFGSNFVLDDISALCVALGIAETDRVLEVGGAGNPFARANVVCDLSFGSCAQRNGAPAVLRDDVTYVEAPAEALPFDDEAFDFVYCTQVLEHVVDPAAACRELARVARRGFIEVPSRLGEMINGNPTHRWVVDLEDATLVFHPRSFVEHPLRNFFYGDLFRDPELLRLAETEYRNLFNHQLGFEGVLGCRVAPARGPVFDYDDPNQAARAHYSFARNALAAGADATYAWPDALEARRLAPDVEATGLLVAVYQARLQRLDDALETLAAVASDAARRLAEMVVAVRDGRYPTADGLPLPPERLGSLPLRNRGAHRPRVSVIVVGASPAALRDAAESALTQDYPDVEVVVAAPVDSETLDTGLAGLHMGARLRSVPLGAGATLAECLNRGSQASGGEILAFLLAGERFLPHHVDRLVAQLEATGAGAVHADRLLVADGIVAGPDVVPGRPESAAASLSTLVARRSTLESTGFFRENDGGPSAPLEFLVRLAEAGVLQHLREATVTSPDALPPGTTPVADARAVMGVNPFELLRSLMAAHVREEGLRARIAELENRHAGQDEVT